MAEEKVHSKLGASSASRWMACPGSVALCEGLTGFESEAAKLGTDAHELAEVCLSSDADAAEYLGFVMGKGNEVDDDMVEAVQVYLDVVRGEPADEVFIEHGFHLDKLHPDLFGTNDYCTYHAKSKKLTVFDYKHGSGVAVEVKANKQLMYYGLGAALSFNFPIDEIELVIVQPRCYHNDGPIRRWSTNLIDLYDWSMDLVDAAKTTEDPNAPLAAGDHCRWCNAAAICPELDRIAKETVLVEFTDMSKYDKQKLADTLDKLPLIEAYVKSVHEFAYQEAMRGEDIPGHKLVEKVGRRQPIKPEAELVPALLKTFTFLSEDAITTKKFAGVTKVESLVKQQYKGRKKTEVETRKGELDKLNAFFEKKSSGYVLVPASDNRQAVSIASAADEFSNLDN